METESILLEQAMPSLGVLDGVLSFIAVERERAQNNAAREASSTADVDDSRDTGSADDGEVEAVEGEGETIEGEEDWKHIVGMSLFLTFLFLFSLSSWAHPFAFNLRSFFLPAYSS